VVNYNTSPEENRIGYLGMEIQDKFEKYDLSLSNTAETYNVAGDPMEERCSARKSNVTSRVY